MAAGTELQLLASLNIGWYVLKIDEVTRQTVFVSPDALALPTFHMSSCSVFEDASILFSKSPHETFCSPHPASKSGKIERQGIAKIPRIVRSVVVTRIVVGIRVTRPPLRRR